MDNTIIKVINHQTIDNDTDTIEEKGVGSCRSKGNKHYIIYDAISDGMKSHVTIIADSSTVRIRRSGAQSSEMLYDTSRKTAFSYSTPYGALEMEIKTIRIVNALESENRLRLVYTLTMQGQKTYNDTEIIIERN